MKPQKTNPTKPNNDDWVDKQIILQNLPISSRTLDRWRKKCGLPSHKISKTILYKWGDVVAFIESN